MTRLRIVHETIYRYRKPVTFGPHRLVLRPREGHDVDVAAMTIEVQPSFELDWSRDVSGNSIATLHLTLASDVLRIRSDVLLDRTTQADAPRDRVRSCPYPVAYDHLEAPLALVYLASSYPDDDPAVRGFLRHELGLPPNGDAATALPRLNAEIHMRIGYQRREQRGVQTPSETLALATGSCRDKAVLFVECARVLGIGARFVSGYLDCPASEAGRASTHAWAEAYLPEIGWCGFDPTLGETTSLKHVVVGVSHHPRGVMPISGTFTGSASDYLGLSVSVHITRSPVSQSVKLQV
jgi:transglutaminase-like putative cysteine protease